MSEIICEPNNVNFTYRGTDKGVKDINLVVSAGQCVGLLGESGCGKSTLAKCISGQQKGVSGDIKCGKIGYIFQDAYSSLNPSKKVGWLLKEVIRYNNKSELSRADDLIKKIISRHKIIKPIIIIIKILLKIHDLNESHKGGMSSFLLFHLVYFFYIKYKNDEVNYSSYSPKEFVYIPPMSIIFFIYSPLFFFIFCFIFFFDSYHLL